MIVNEAGRACIRRVPWDAKVASVRRRLAERDFDRASAPRPRTGEDQPGEHRVRMYQHDVKHLRNSLDAVVESSVIVGVDVNTASPALLRYVSGMNQLTARRLCDIG